MRVQKVSWNSEDFGREVVDSFVNTGFAVITDHNLNQRLVDAVYEDWKRFFAMSDEQKRSKIFNEKTQAGWFPAKAEKAKDAAFPDMKEFYHFYKDLEPASITTDLTNALERMAITMLALIEQELRNRGVQILCEESLAKSVTKSEKTLFRLLHYPPTRQFGLDAELMERAAAHEDINMITLLPAATNPGLQVRDVNGNWHDVEADPGSIIVNVGDMLSEAVGGYLPSTTHRVVADHIARNESRYSMPLFLHPRPEVRLSPRYTAQSYLTERLIQLGLIKKETQDDAGRTDELVRGPDQVAQGDDQPKQPGGPQD
jgi:isopenicillin N synthase-like dioxygenase